MNEKSFEKVRMGVAILLALGIAFLIIFLVSDTPIETMKYFVIGPLTSKRYMGNVVEAFIPLALTGLATAVLFQANLFNLGSEGLYYIGGLIASVVAIYFFEGSIFHSILAILIASTITALLSLIPGILKAKYNANELVTSLMFNSIYFGIGMYILNVYIRDTNQTALASYKFAESAKLQNIVPGTRIHSGLIIVFVVTALVYFLLYKTKLGYNLRMVGANSLFAENMGVKAFAVIVYAHLISGFIAGMAGSVEVLGMYDRFRWSALPGIGFDGALVAMLGKNNPIGVLGGAFFLAYIRVGADIMARKSGVPFEMVDIIQAILILLISGELFLAKWREKQLLKEKGVK